MARPVASWDSALIFCRSSCDNSVIALSGYKMPAMTSALRSLAAAPKPPAKAGLSFLVIITKVYTKKISTWNINYRVW
ncbi:hypothetical protein A9G42_11705 [Gilliamella sp. Nev6-6]|nr:hypothetical protein A9G42_11705 [Gilliamella apicola]